MSQNFLSRYGIAPPPPPTQTIDPRLLEMDANNARRSSSGSGSGSESHSAERDDENPLNVLRRTRPLDEADPNTRPTARARSNVDELQDLARSLCYTAQLSQQQTSNVMSKFLNHSLDGKLIAIEVHLYEFMNKVTIHDARNHIKSSDFKTPLKKYTSATLLSAKTGAYREGMLDQMMRLFRRHPDYLKLPAEFVADEACWDALKQALTKQLSQTRNNILSKLRISINKTQPLHKLTSAVMKKTVKATPEHYGRMAFLRTVLKKFDDDNEKRVEAGTKKKKKQAAQKKRNGGGGGTPEAEPEHNGEGDEEQEVPGVVDSDSDEVVEQETPFWLYVDKELAAIRNDLKRHRGRVEREKAESEVFRSLLYHDMATYKWDHSALHIIDDVTDGPAQWQTDLEGELACFQQDAPTDKRPLTGEAPQE